MENIEYNINQYLRAGKKLTLLSGKRPILDDWTNIEVSKKDLYAHTKKGGNIGWVIGDSDLVIDVDPKNGGDKSFVKLQYDIGVQLHPSVKTPSGGAHVYLTLPDEIVGYDLKKTLNIKYPGIDFLSKGAQCVIAGCATSKGEYEWVDILGEFEQTPCPMKLIELLSYKVAKPKIKTVDDLSLDEEDPFDGLIGGDSANWSYEKVNKMLSKLDPSMGHDQWVKIGMALHDWDPIEGLTVWEKWSKDGDNYTKGETEKRWKSFSIGGGVTLGTVSYMVKEVVFEDEMQEVNQILARIEDANEKEIEFSICVDIRKLVLNRLNREKLVKAIQDRYKVLTGVRMPIGNIRAMIIPVDIVTGAFIEDGEVPEWCNDWIYINTHSGYLNLKTLKLFKHEGFNLECGKYIPMSEGGTKPSAAKFVADRGYIETADYMMYLPTYDGLICHIDGAKVVNSFNHKSIPIAAGEYSDKGREVIRMVEKHILTLFGSEQNANIFTQWLAHNVQYPGKQILWAPIIQSIQGVGKSFFGELLRGVLGDRNVGTVSPTQVTSDFNGWATNVLVNILEEIRVVGHSRYEAVNALKPLITDRMFQVNDKGIKQYMTYNTCNYLSFTNFKDAIPIDEEDRRWWVIFVKFQTLSEMGRALGEDIGEYFPKLFGMMREYSDELRKWLLEYPITEEFKNTKQAPITNEKKSMIATDLFSMEGLTEVKQLLEKGGEYYNKNVISSSHLFNDLVFVFPELDLNSTKKHAILKKLGYTTNGKLIKIDGKPLRMWTKYPMGNEEIRAMLSGSDLWIEDF